MNRADFNTLTDWIGIPLSIALLAVIVLVDSRLVSMRRLTWGVVAVVTVLMIAAIAVNVSRFIRLA